MKPTIYLIEQISRGSLSIMAKPASGEQIDVEFKHIADRGINTIVSLLELGESAEVGLQDEETLAIKNGMAFHSFPIKDYGFPASKDQFKVFSKSLFLAASGGENIVIHCRAGIGRSGLMAAGVLLHNKYEPLDAFSHISKQRGETVPETDEQKSWLVENYEYITNG